MLKRFGLLLCFGLLVLCHQGCGSPPPGPPKATSVEGTVTLDGKSVPTGEVHFVKQGAPPNVLEITDGYFSGDASVGDNQVEIYTYVEGPPNPRFPDVPVKTNVAPQKYWGPNTTLKATVKEGAANEFKFEMSSK